MTPTPGGPLVRLAELEIDPAQLGRYLELLRGQISASIAGEPGVSMLYALSVKGRPSSIRILEVYADQGAYETHLRSPHFLEYKSETEDMVLSLRLIETDPIILGLAPPAA